MFYLSNGLELQTQNLCYHIMTGASIPDEWQSFEEYLIFKCQGLKCVNSQQQARFKIYCLWDRDASFLLSVYGGVNSSCLDLLFIDLYFFLLCFDLLRMCRLVQNFCTSHVSFPKGGLFSQGVELYLLAL